MLTSQKVIDAINEQIMYEFSAELQYYAIAAHFAVEALPQTFAAVFHMMWNSKSSCLQTIYFLQTTLPLLLLLPLVTISNAQTEKAKAQIEEGYVTGADNV